MSRRAGSSVPAGTGVRRHGAAGLGDAGGADVLPVASYWLWAGRPPKTERRRVTWCCQARRSSCSTIRRRGGGGAVVADLPFALARSAEVGTGSTDVTLAVPLPIPLGGVHAVRLVAPDLTSTAAESAACPTFPRYGAWVGRPLSSRVVGKSLHAHLPCDHARGDRGEPQLVVDGQHPSVGVGV